MNTAGNLFWTNVTQMLKENSESLRSVALYMRDGVNDKKMKLYGYTVKKEQLYEVVFYVDEEDDRCLLMKTGKTISFKYESQNEGHYQQQFTEAEIKEIDERYWAFAVEVDE